jgi:hypothetical protein
VPVFKVSNVLENKESQESGLIPKKILDKCADLKDVKDKMSEPGTDNASEVEGYYKVAYSYYFSGKVSPWAEGRISSDPMTFDQKEDFSDICEKVTRGELFLYKVVNGKFAKVSDFGKIMDGKIKIATSSEYVGDTFNQYIQNKNYIYYIARNNQEIDSFLVAYNIKEDKAENMRDILPFDCAKEGCPFVVADKGYHLLTDNKNLYLYDFSLTKRYLLKEDIYKNKDTYFGYEFVGTYEKPDMVLITEGNKAEYIDIDHILKNEGESIFGKSSADFRRKIAMQNIDNLPDLNLQNQNKIDLGPISDVTNYEQELVKTNNFKKEIKNICESLRDKYETVDMVQKRNVDNIKMLTEKGSYYFMDLLPEYTGETNEIFDKYFSQYIQTYKTNITIYCAQKTYGDWNKDRAAVLYKINKGNLIEVGLLKNLVSENVQGYSSLVKYYESNDYVFFAGSITLEKDNYKIYYPTIFTYSIKDSKEKKMKDITYPEEGVGSFVTYSKNYYVLSDKKAFYLYDMNKSIRFFLKNYKEENVSNTYAKLVGAYDNPDLVQIVEKGKSSYFKIKDVLNTKSESIFEDIE